jgi:hypothetical protein
MAGTKYRLIATISTDNAGAVRPVLARLVAGRGSVEEVAAQSAAGEGKGDFRVQAEMEGASAKDLNRALLSALRQAEKRTRLRAEWTSGDTTERFFDYVLKKTTTKH